MNRQLLVTAMTLLAWNAQAQQGTAVAPSQPTQPAPQIQQAPSTPQPIAAQPVVAQPAVAQPVAPQPQFQKGLAQQWGLVVFPAKGQTRDVQDKDEFDCYKWSKDATGIDPLGPPPPLQQGGQGKPPPGTGAVAAGTVGGAIGGAAIGAIAGDAGRGAAIGATAGVMRGMRNRIVAQKQAEQRAEAETRAYAQQRQAGFNRGFGACLEGKGYTVR